MSALRSLVNSRLWLDCVGDPRTCGWPGLGKWALGVGREFGMGLAQRLVWGGFAVVLAQPALGGDPAFEPVPLMLPG